MGKHARRCLLTLLATVLAGSAAGCDLGSLMYFIMPEAREEAGMRHLASEDPKKVPRVVIFTSMGLETRAEFLQADRQLSELLGKQLHALAAANGEHLAIVPTRQVEQFKNTHPRWRTMDPRDIAQAFNADYLIDLEISSLTLYEHGSGNSLLRGRADLTVTLVDAKNPDDTQVQKDVHCVFPEAQGPIPAGFDANPMEFRQAFLGHVAKRLSWCFSRYPKRERYFVEGPDVNPG
jgi:hypothetical protein